MRTIKFRAIDAFSDEFIYGQAFFIDSDNDQGYIADGIDRHHLVKKETVGQYTGLKGKNGVEIYEGDFLTDFRGKNEWKVEFRENGCFEALNIKTFNYSLIMDIWDIEIIGNIHENKELLKQ